jgi:hypothetical protein
MQGSPGPYAIRFVLRSQAEPEDPAMNPFSLMAALSATVVLPCRAFGPLLIVCTLGAWPGLITWIPGSSAPGGAQVAARARASASLNGLSGPAQAAPACIQRAPQRELPSASSRAATSASR